MQKIDKEQLREALEHLPVVQSRRVYAYYRLGMKKREIARGGRFARMRLFIHQHGTEKI